MKASSPIWRDAKSFFVTVFSLAAIGATVYGLFAALHSTQFTVRVVEVADLPENAPVDAHTISTLAAVPIGKVNLFELGLDEIEKRVLAHVWVREVHIEKHFPQTVLISVVLREPRALIQNDAGAVSYVDSNGKVFGKVNLSVQPDLPMFSGALEATERRMAALQLLDQWENSPLGQMSQISSVVYDDERGFRVLITYRFSRARPGGNGADRGRAMVDLGLELGDQLQPQLGRIGRVVRYLADNGISARQIFADAGKKIVVKIARGS